jgi:hypothetical protein
VEDASHLHSLHKSNASSTEVRTEVLVKPSPTRETTAVFSIPFPRCADHTWPVGSRQLDQLATATGYEVRPVSRQGGLRAFRTLASSGVPPAGLIPAENVATDEQSIVGS